ncbi:urease accessory protein UreE [Aquirhabdus parva]|uniref:Urease accessory protein UreE n=1 Tax=Aquirhabdus parva TaxID=2283318 RepID=A0A345P846_9GAMM|nr:urease accessory protein UreE [Aquirhabdus parva]AXI03455.1 urease accessory protein UreE [Aquirhabdus parva]
MNLYTIRLPKDFQPKADVETLALPFDTRQKSRFRATLASGIDIGVDLPRTGVLRSGAYIATQTDEALQIVAAAETVMQAVAADSFTLLKAAYHLGNRHVPLMLTPDAVYFEPDHVLAEMVEGLGLTVTTMQHPFEPESGAYAQHAHETRLRPLPVHH